MLQTWNLVLTAEGTLIMQTRRISVLNNWFHRQGNPLLTCPDCQSDVLQRTHLIQETFWNSPFLVLTLRNTNESETCREYKGHIIKYFVNCCEKYIIYSLIIKDVWHDKMYPKINRSNVVGAFKLCGPRRLNCNKLRENSSCLVTVVFRTQSLLVMRKHWSQRKCNSKMHFLT
jgi:hypothetical protein